MARDYGAELLEIEKQRIARNEATRAEGQAERDRLESAIKENPEHEAIYKEAIEASKASEESYVNANDKLAANKVNQVEADQRAELESAKGGVMIVEPPPGPVNDNSADQNSILAVAKRESEAAPAAEPAAEQQAGGGILQSLNDSGLLQPAQNLMGAIGLLNMVEATVVHPMGHGNPSWGELMNQTPALERNVTQAELHGAVDPLVSSPPIGPESASAAPAQAQTPTLEDALQKFDKTVHDKMDRRVPQEETPRSRMQGFNESGAKSAEALEHANQNARSRSADDIVQPPPPPPPPQVPANDNTLQQ